MRSSIVGVISSSLLPQWSCRQSPLPRGIHSLTAVQGPPSEAGRSCSGRSSDRCFSLSETMLPPNFPLFSLTSFTSFTSLTSLPSKALQFRHFPHRQRSIFSRSNVQHQRPQLHALDLLHQKPHALKHPPNLAISPFDQNHLIPGIRPVLRQTNFRRRSSHPLAILQLNRNSRAQTRNRLLIRLPADFH